ncbi:MAG: hypothetical protein A3F09_01545 [Chlamydiae bacterium RIFCSPHIGHO2_12_FULL_49_11]|nr:MAG: hypothetical protein A3F09_01545 [Chlamydiae bacterium RIFCSPHIGHO2_12_FULL_49_11]
MTETRAAPHITVMQDTPKIPGIPDPREERQVNKKIPPPEVFREKLKKEKNSLEQAPAAPEETAPPSPFSTPAKGSTSLSPQPEEARMSTAPASPDKNVSKTEKETTPYDPKHPSAFAAPEQPQRAQNAEVERPFPVTPEQNDTIPEKARPRFSGPAPTQPEGNLPPMQSPEPSKPEENHPVMYSPTTPSQTERSRPQPSLSPPAESEEILHAGLEENRHAAPLPGNLEKNHPAIPGRTKPEETEHVVPGRTKPEEAPHATSEKDRHSAPLPEKSRDNPQAMPITSKPEETLHTTQGTAIPEKERHAIHGPGILEKDRHAISRPAIPNENRNDIPRPVPAKPDSREDDAAALLSKYAPEKTSLPETVIRAGEESQKIAPEPDKKRIRKARGKDEEDIALPSEKNAQPGIVSVPPQTERISPVAAKSEEKDLITTGSNIPTANLTRAPTAQEAIVPPFTELSSNAFDLFEKMIGYVTLETAKGISRTTVTVNMPGTIFHGSEIHIDHYDTAPHSFNVRFHGQEEAVNQFTQNLPQFNEALKAITLPFQINLQQPVLLQPATERPHLIQRKENVGKESDTDKH